MLMNPDVKPEIQICTQPQLGPPMRLTAYDDDIDNDNNSHFVTPPPPPRPRIHHDRNIPSRSSFRASLSFKRQSTIGPRISAPSDFRRVQSMTYDYPMHEAKEKTQFLELSIYNNPHHRLSNLPSFENFYVDDDPAAAVIKRPPRAISLPPKFSLPPVPRACRSGSPASASFRLPRKPVGTGPAPCRSSTTAAARPTVPALRHSTMTSPLIPQFATVQRSSLTTPTSRALSMSADTSTILNRDHDIRSTLQERKHIHDTTITDVEEKDISTDTNDDTTPPTSPTPTLTSPQNPPKPSTNADKHTRTWSGSTLASSTYTCAYTFKPTSPSCLSFPAPSSPSPPVCNEGKGFDLSVLPRPESGSACRPGSRAGLGPSGMVYSTPTIYEGEQVVGYGYT